MYIINEINQNIDIMADDKTNVTDQTTVGQIDLDLDDLFGGTPGSDSIVLPESNQKKPNLFSKESVDLSFIDQDDEEDIDDEDIDSYEEDE